MGKAVKFVGGAVLFVALAIGGAALWGSQSAAALLETPVEVHTVDLAVPIPLTDAELEALRAEGRGQGAEPADDAEPATEAGEQTEPVDPLADVDLEALALERAVARGEHLVNVRYFCTACHGENLGGGVMIDDPALGSLLGPNITSGSGSRSADYGPSDWDRIVRHGVRKDGRPAVMPSGDFLEVSDNELSDMVAYIRSVPPVDNTVPAPSFGPVGTMLVATGKLPLTAHTHPDHMANHAVAPPETAPTAEFGRHLGATCTGCHGAGMAGGPVAAGDPSWPPAANLTPHEQGLATWSFEDFDKAMRTGTRPDGGEFGPPMSEVVPFAVRFTEIEMQALWAFLQTLPAAPTPG